MSERQEGPKAAGASGEMLSAGRFQEELRRVTRFRLYQPVGDPLDSAVKRIERNPAYSQSRLLTRVLAALTYEHGEFRRAEVASFDSETLSMVISLMDARTAGTSPHEDWVRAVDAAVAAQAGAGG